MKVTTNSDHKPPVFDNLLKLEFDVAQPDQVQWKNYQTRFKAQQDILNYLAMFITATACIFTRFV